jgi:hypothetical protein
MWQRVLSKDEKNIPQAKRKIEGDTSGTLEESSMKLKEVSGPEGSAKKLQN